MSTEDNTASKPQANAAEPKPILNGRRRSILQRLREPKIIEYALEIPEENRESSGLKEMFPEGKIPTGTFIVIVKVQWSNVEGDEGVVQGQIIGTKLESGNPIGNPIYEVKKYFELYLDFLDRGKTAIECKIS